MAFCPSPTLTKNNGFAAQILAPTQLASFPGFYLPTILYQRMEFGGSQPGFSPPQSRLTACDLGTVRGPFLRPGELDRRSVLARGL